MPPPPPCGTETPPYRPPRAAQTAKRSASSPVAAPPCGRGSGLPDAGGPMRGGGSAGWPGWRACTVSARLCHRAIGPPRSRRAALDSIIAVVGTLQSVCRCPHPSFPRKLGFASIRGAARLGELKSRMQTRSLLLQSLYMIVVGTQHNVSTPDSSGTTPKTL